MALLPNLIGFAADPGKAREVRIAWAQVDENAQYLTSIDAACVSFNYVSKSRLFELEASKAEFFARSQAAYVNEDDAIYVLEWGKFDAHALRHELGHGVLSKLPSEMLQFRNLALSDAAYHGERIVKALSSGVIPVDLMPLQGQVGAWKKLYREGGNAEAIQKVIALSMNKPRDYLERVAQKAGIQGHVVGDGQYLTLAIHHYLGIYFNVSVPFQSIIDEIMCYRCGADPVFSDRVFDTAADAWDLKLKAENGKMAPLLPITYKTTYRLDGSRFIYRKHETLYLDKAGYLRFIRDGDRVFLFPGDDRDLVTGTRNSLRHLARINDQSPDEELEAFIENASPKELMAVENALELGVAVEDAIDAVIYRPPGNGL